MRPLRGSLGALAAALAVAAVLIAAAGVLAALPAVFAFALLFAGRYPGADRLDRLIAGHGEHPASHPPAPVPRPLTIPLCSRGGELIARSLAKRPPPALPSSA